MPTVLITGANRGIGFALVEEFLVHGWRVLGCCRQPDEAAFAHMPNCQQLVLHELEVTDSTQIDTLAKACENESIDIIINVAGLFGPRDLLFGNTPVDSWLKVLHVNTIAPLKLVEALIEPICRSDLKIVAAISSDLGSMTLNEFGGATIYRSSKAALNSVIKGLSIDLVERGVKTVSVHPGWVKTEMGGEDAKITAQESVSGIYRLLNEPAAFKNGGLYSYLGDEMPW